MKFVTKYFETHPFAKSGFLVIPLITFVVLMGNYSPKEAPEGFKSFVLAFEFAQTPEEINALFNNLSTETIKNIDIGIYLDYGFMIIYSFLLAFFFMKSARISNMKWLLAGIPLSVLIFFGDFFENILLLKITQNYTSGINNIELSSLLEKLHIITWLKWGGLAVAFLMISMFFFKGNWLSKLAALVCLSPFMFSLFALSNSPVVVSIFTQTVFAAFAVLIFYCFLFRK